MSRNELSPGVIGAFAAIYLVWGSTYLAIAFAVESIPPFLAISSRFGLAGVGLYAWLRMRGSARPAWNEVVNAAVVGAMTVGVGTGAVAWAEQYLASGIVALIVSTVPVWMVLLDWRWLGGGAPSPQVSAGLVLGVLGIVILVGPDVLRGGLSGNRMATLAVLAGSISWSVGSLRSRRSAMPARPLMSAAIQMIGGALLVGVAALVAGEHQTFRLSAVTLLSFGGWVYLVIFGSVLAFSAYVWLLGRTSPKKISSYAYVNPVVAVFLGWLLAGEPVDARILAAVGVLVTAVALIVRYGISTPHSSESPAGEHHEESTRRRPRGGRNRRSRGKRAA